jgi:hypothetical protein
LLRDLLEPLTPKGARRIGHTLSLPLHAQLLDPVPIVVPGDDARAHCSWDWHRLVAPGERLNQCDEVRARASLDRWDTTRPGVLYPHPHSLGLFQSERATFPTGALPP